MDWQKCSGIKRSYLVQHVLILIYVLPPQLRVYLELIKVLDLMW
ncbi:Uncharacterised protein [Shigella dysenteriae]|nr:Uncharacterised protein [Shigella dysenteriae]